ncbi:MULTISPECIES: hypothetical protein [Acidianus]|uniref:hypothetical protein n=1 Tax=Acidianus TaxID=12914 RepID=UPI000694ED13|nr:MULTISPECIES: hypothetical protein [Acidianus]NON62997.1 RNase P p30-like protein [Acidianus sp. RZ1]
MEGIKGRNSRLTFTAKNRQQIFENVKRSSGFRLRVCKPLTKDALRYAIINDSIDFISIDDSNFFLLKKSMLNLIRQKTKPVEISLSSSSNVIFKAIRFGYKWIDNLVFSSCAKDFNELWPPLSKINYLIIHGADEEMALYWTYVTPAVSLNDSDDF